ncbi:MAG: hypothetical protein U1D55_15500 [Phycisphaerae bacterium]
MRPTDELLNDLFATLSEPEPALERVLASARRLLAWLMSDAAYAAEFAMPA